MADGVSSSASWRRLAWLLWLGGCGGPESVPCMGMDVGALAGSATNFELDDYGATVDCDGPHAPAGATPLDRRSFHAGEAVSLSLAPGRHTVVLLAFDDAMTLLGSGCVTQELPPGGKICVDLTLAPAPDLAGTSPIDQALPCAQACDVDGGTLCCNPINGSCSATCAILCVGLYRDCNGNPADGCETNLGAPSSCGTSCGKLTDCTTTVKNASAIGCSNGACTFTCNAGFASCDGIASNGCETSLWQPTACGASCGSRIDCTTTLMNATGVMCATGTCAFAGCASGFGDCDGVASNGCEANLWQTSACGTSCTTRVDCTTTVQHASGPFCASGACSYATCSGAYGDCDGDKTNGCETPLDTTSSCGTMCGALVDCNATVMNATVTGCSAGACTFNCTSGFGDCDGVASNGCETNLNALTTCGTTCTNKVDCTKTVKNASGISCASGACGYTSCFAGYTNCSGNPANGCQTAQHIDGLAEFFTDCSIANGAWSMTLANEAFNAWDATGTKRGTGVWGTSPDQLFYVCNDSSVRNHCACWSYLGTGNQASYSGTVFLSAYNACWLSGSGSNHGSQYSWY